MNLAALILCGGKSSRMGADKATLMWEGRTWLDQTVQTLRLSGISDVYVSGSRAGYSALPDLVEAKGPVGGICSSIMQIDAKYDALMIVPVDMPRLKPTTLKALFAGLKGYEACYYDNLPLCLRLSADIRHHAGRVLDALKAGDTCSVTYFLKDLKANALPVDGRDDLKNFNNPDDLSG